MTPVLVDTSVWVEWLRGGNGPAARLVEELAVEPATAICVTQPVVMELRCGAPAAQLTVLDDVLSRMTMLAVDADIDFAVAADLYRAVRAAGHTPRSTLDCLIGAVALRRSAVPAHRDRDFPRIAAVAPSLVLRSASV